MSIYDSLYNLTKRKIKHLKDFWAGIFSEQMFTIVDEERFRVLYSDNLATSPNNKGLINGPISGLSDLSYNHLFFVFSFQRTYRIKFAA